MKEFLVKSKKFTEMVVIRGTADQSGSLRSLVNQPGAPSRATGYSLQLAKLTVHFFQFWLGFFGTNVFSQ